MQYQQLGKAVRIILLLILIVIILVYAKPFLVPLTFAAILSMLILPIARWLERKGWGRILATLTAVLALLAAVALLVFLVSWQLTGLEVDAQKIEQQVSSIGQQLQQYISNKLGIPPEKQKQMLQQQQSSAPGRLSGLITGILSGLGGFLTDLVLTLVYIFLFLYFRRHLKNFVLKLVRKEEQANTAKIIDKAQHVSQKYLTGLGLMIVCLWIMYGIGFTVIGVKNAIFFAILCGLLEIVPFVGNITGTLITIGMSLVQGGDVNMVIGIAITYGVVQFLQTYILEPLVVGAEVNVNPLFTIVGIVAGEMLWGIPGMVLAIPLLGIAKIVCEHIEPLKPYAYLIGNGEKGKEKGFVQKVKGWFK